MPNGAKTVTRNVEAYLGWEDHTWSTHFVAIPADTPEDKVEEAVRVAVSKLNWTSGPPAFCGLYWDTPLDEEDANDRTEDQ